MATAVGGGGSDDRRSPVLAAEKAGRERGGAEIPAHRAGGRRPVYGTRLRAALAYVSVAVTTMVAVAFLIPLGLVVQQLAEDRAAADARAQAAAVAAVLGVQSDRAAIEKTINTSGEAPDHVAVRALPEGDPRNIGTGRA